MLCDSCLEKDTSCSDPCDSCTQEVQTKSYDQGYAICENDLPKAYNAPARIDLCSNVDAYLTGSFIYFEVILDQIDLSSIYIFSHQVLAVQFQILLKALFLRFQLFFS